MADLADDELLQFAAAARRQTSWAQARELAAIAELSRRRTDAETAGDPDYRILSAHESVTEEIAAALTITGNAAATLVHLSECLSGPLADTAAALETGRIDMARARVICDATDGMPDQVTRQLQTAALEKAPGQTTGQLRRRIKRIAHRLAPAAAEERKREAVRARRLELWDTPAGTADLALCDLPPEDAHAIYNKITAAAQGLKQDGDPRPLPQLRADLATLLLRGTPLPAAIRALLTEPPRSDVTDALDAARPLASPPTPREHNPHGIGGREMVHGVNALRHLRSVQDVAGVNVYPDAHGTSGRRNVNGLPDLHGLPDVHGAHAVQDLHSARLPAAIRSDLVRPLHPGENPAHDTLDDTGPDLLDALPPPPRGPGPQGIQAPHSGNSPDTAQTVDAQDALATAGVQDAMAAVSVQSAMATAGVQDAMAALGVHGAMVTAGVQDVMASAGAVGPLQAAGSEDLPEPGTARAAGAGQDAVVRALAGMVEQRLTHVRDRVAPRVLPAAIARAVQGVHDELAPARDAVCQGGDETHGRPGYRPPEALRRDILARHGTCVFPTCNRDAGRCDLDHTVPWRPGTTCRCNLAPLCRRHHRLKQTPGWTLHQIWPGLMIWTSPSGGWYVVHPDRE
ncbi:DUF222 domain-containing protein [Spirillospora sp. NPDC047418]